MKRAAWCWLLLVSAAVSATGLGDYARQWPLQLERNGEGAYRVVLDREVYRTARQPQLHDVDVFNANGTTVPAAVLTEDAPMPSRVVELPWFALPTGQAGRAQDIAVISDRAADGSVRRVETRLTDSAPTAPSGAWLIDASALRDPIVALQVDWTPSDHPIDVAYRVEGSDDLRDWRILQPQAQLVDLLRAGARLRQNRIVLDGSARYLRLLPQQRDAALTLKGVRAELATAVDAGDWRWETLEGRRVIERGQTYYDFDLGGPFPIDRVDAMLPDNDAGEWTLQSRDANDAVWRTHLTGWMVFQVDASGSASRSQPQALAAIVRDRYWRLSPTTQASAAPRLRLGYRPETVVFLANGKPPYVLAAGSARAVRKEAPVSQLLGAMHAQRGTDWQPGIARLGAAQTSAGTRAFDPAPVQRDWKSWLLWGVLIGGALIVAVFAFSLLRKPNSP